MKRIITTERIPVKLWLDEIEPEAERQVKTLANLPFAFGHIAVLPDCHEGYGMPIGAVLAAYDAIVPNAVGVDIGCGMNAVRTSLESIEVKDLKKIVELIKKVVPVGFRHQNRMQDESLMPELKNSDRLEIVTEEYKSALFQLGTLGGGNHFIEIQKGSDGFIWIMVHSGSRNLGKKVADYYNKLAEKLNQKQQHSCVRSNDLAWLPLGTAEASAYISEMSFCQNFAASNRMLIMQRIKDNFTEASANTVVFGQNIDIAHNYARPENHLGNDLIIHRKGATSARLNEKGIIPGSQGSVSYIVSGLGNPESFMSCSHGAGRKMSRHKAQKTFDLREVVDSMNRLGIIHGIKNIRDLDEAPGAYKNIGMVMENQKDLVSILVELKPLAVIKG